VTTGRGAQITNGPSHQKRKGKRTSTTNQGRPTNIVKSPYDQIKRRETKYRPTMEKKKGRRRKKRESQEKRGSG